MKHTYTSKDLIQFLYKEFPKQETNFLREQVQSNWTLSEEYKMLREAYQQLPKVSFSPKKETIRNILEYSSNAALKPC